MSHKTFTVRILLAGLVILLSLRQAGPVSAAGNSWISIGPAGGQVHALAFDPVNPNTFYVATANGVFKTTNGGGNWASANTGLTDLLVYALVVEPGDPNTLYAGTEDGVFKTTNGGGSWIGSSTGMGASFDFVAALAIAPGGQNRLYAGAPEAGVFLSTNGGTYWSAVNTGLTTTLIYNLAINPQHTNVMYAGTLDSGVFKSNNGGGFWAPVNLGLTELNVQSVAVDPQNSDTVYAGTYGGGVFKSTIGGGDWTPVNNGLPSLFIHSLVIDPEYPNILYAGTSGNGVFISANGGGNWTAVNSGLTNPDIMILAINPANPNLLYAGTMGGGVFVIGVPVFADVPVGYWAASWIKRLYAAGVTSGCGTNPLIYCPEDPVTRAQMAVFLERGKHGATYLPPAGTGTVFGDVPFSYWANSWIEKLYADGITTGCVTSPLLYCPENPVTRAEMAVFLLRAKHGAHYTPPPVGDTGFDDVPVSYWAAAWIKELAFEGITSGCSSDNYCPENSVTRAQMAKFLVLTFNLP